MKIVLAGFGIVQGVMAALFALAALVLTLIAARLGWDAVSAGLNMDAAQAVIESVGLLAAAVVHCRSRRPSRRRK